MASRFQLPKQPLTQCRSGRRVHAVATQVTLDSAAVVIHGFENHLKGHPPHLASADQFSGVYPAIVRVRADGWVAGDGMRHRCAIGVKDIGRWYPGSTQEKRNDHTGPILSQRASDSHSRRVGQQVCDRGDLRPAYFDDRRVQVGIFLDPWPGTKQAGDIRHVNGEFGHCFEIGYFRLRTQIDRHSVAVLASAL